MHAFDRQTDRQTDGQTDGQKSHRKTALHSMQRGKNRNLCLVLLFTSFDKSDSIYATCTCLLIPNNALVGLYVGCDMVLSLFGLVNIPVKYTID